VHVGIFIEELRQGASQAEAFRDIFELADRCEAWGVPCVWLGSVTNDGAAPTGNPLRSAVSDAIACPSGSLASTATVTS